MKPARKKSHQRAGQLATAGVYLASRFARRDEMREVARDLDAAGFLVTSRWLESPVALSGKDLGPSGPAGQLAAMDLEDLRRSDLCIAFTEAAEQAQRGRGGRHTELGIAIGLGLEVAIVGPREHVFHALAAVQQYPDWPTARAALPSARRDVNRLVAI